MRDQNADRNARSQGADSKQGRLRGFTVRAAGTAGQLLWIALSAAALSTASMARAETCSQADIMLSNQTAVDQFQSVYGPCDEIAGDLFIIGFTFLGSDISNLAPLDDITRVSGNLTLQFLSQLEGVNGLSSLAEVGGNLVVNANSELTHLDGLGGLEVVHGEIYLENLPALGSIAGLGALHLVGGDFTIGSAGQLQSFSGFPALVTHLPGGLSVVSNPKLVDVSALANLSHIGGTLRVSQNSRLHSLQGLDALESIGEDLRLATNPVLVDCTPLLKVLDAHDDGAAGPGPGIAGIPDIGGDILLQGNRPVCSDRALIGDLVSANSFE